ncbi:hypothetical protein GmRootV116_49520 [Variovorax sp. V116]
MFECARRLPGNFAWIAVAVDAALFAAAMAARLLPLSPHAEQMRGVYAQPGVWVPLLSRVAAVWLLAATLAWCHARKALDERGAARIAQLRGPGSRFGAVFLAAMAVNMLVLTPLFYQVQLLFMPGGPLHQRVGMYGLPPVMALSMLVQSAIQMFVLVASVWLAARFALRERGMAPVDASRGAADDGGADTAPPRRVVALVAAATFVSLQAWLGHVASSWVDTSRDSDLAPLLLGWFAVPLLVWALAFWGGWLGAAPGPAQARPFRAVAAAVSVFALLQVVCAALALGGLWWIAAASFSGVSSGSRLTALAIALAAVYLVLLVLAMRAFTRRLYRRYL